MYTNYQNKVLKRRKTSTASYDQIILVTSLVPFIKIEINRTKNTYVYLTLVFVVILTNANSYIPSIVF